MGAAREVWDAAKHPRGWRGRFSEGGQVDRAAFPNAVNMGRIQINATRTKAGKRRMELDHAGPLSVSEGPMWFKRGKAKTPSRFSGGRKSTTKFNVPAVDLVNGKWQEVTVPRRKIPWRA